VGEAWELSKKKLFSFSLPLPFSYVLCVPKVKKRGKVYCLDAHIYPIYR
jgi:hypothetical protein